MDLPRFFPGWFTALANRRNEIQNLVCDCARLFRESFVARKEHARKRNLQVLVLRSSIEPTSKHFLPWPKRP
jgi:hypothetical protein